MTNFCSVAQLQKSFRQLEQLVNSEYKAQDLTFCLDDLESACISPPHEAIQTIKGELEMIKARSLGIRNQLQDQQFDDIQSNKTSCDCSTRNIVCQVQQLQQVDLEMQSQVENINVNNSVCQQKIENLRQQKILQSNNFANSSKFLFMSAPPPLEPVYSPKLINPLFMTQIAESIDVAKDDSIEKKCDNSIRQPQGPSFLDLSSFCKNPGQRYVTHQNSSQVTLLQQPVFPGLIDGEGTQLQKKIRQNQQNFDSLDFLLTDDSCRSWNMECKEGQTKLRSPQNEKCCSLLSMQSCNAPAEGESVISRSSPANAFTSHREEPSLLQPSLLYLEKRSAQEVSNITYVTQEASQTPQQRSLIEVAPQQLSYQQRIKALKQKQLPVQILVPRQNK